MLKFRERNSSAMDTKRLTAVKKRRYCFCLEEDEGIKVKIKSLHSRVKASWLGVPAPAEDIRVSLGNNHLTKLTKHNTAFCNKAAAIRICGRSTT